MKNYECHFGFVVAGKVHPNDIIGFEERPRFGRYWWFWLPNVNWNGGWFTRKECVDVNFQWLCFSIGLTFFHTGKR